MGKIKAYTLMEVTVAMLLSAVCIGICYSAYGIIGNYYAVFREKNEKMDNLFSLRQVLERDMEKANLIMRTEGGIILDNDSVKVSYIFAQGKILRKLSELRTDTFNILWKEQYMGYEGIEILSADTIDVLRFNIELDVRQQVPCVFYKHYSAENLFH